MGQLEKYGLYVLCLVIFLILGVTMWPGGDVAAQGPRTTTAPIDVRSSSGGAQPMSLDQLFSTERDKKVSPPNVTPSPAPSPAPGPTPTPTPTPSPAPQPPAPTMYTVKPGDTLEGIALTMLGSRALAGEIQKLNPSVDPRRMRPGTELKLPAKAAAKTDSPAPAPAVGGDYRLYTVVDGDSLARIARVELGAESRVDELLKLNAGLDPLRLAVGQQIRLPKK